MQGNVVKFNQQGTRQTTTLDVFQYHPGEKGMYKAFMLKNYNYNSLKSYGFQ